RNHCDTRRLAKCAIVSVPTHKAILPCACLRSLTTRAGCGAPCTYKRALSPCTSQALSSVPQQLLNPSTIDFRVIVEGLARPVHHAVRSEIYRIKASLPIRQISCVLVVTRAAACRCRAAFRVAQLPRWRIFVTIEQFFGPL